MKSIYLDITKKFLNDNKEKMEAEAIKSDGEKDHLTYSASEAEADIMEVKIDEIDNDTITIVANVEGLSIYLNLDLTTDDLIDLIEIATKKFNKVKTMLEAVK